STLLLPSALSDLLAFLSQWTPIADASLGFLTIQHRLSDCFFSLCLSLPRCASRGPGRSKDGIMLAPHGQERRLRAPEVLLPHGNPCSNTRVCACFSPA